MKTVTIKQMIENSNIPASLIRATIKQFGGFDMFKESAIDVTNHGISGGIHGFIYYTDTCAFYAKHRGDILAVGSEWADNCDGSLPDFVKSFNCLDATEEEIALTLYCAKAKHDTQVANALAWFAAEEVCRLYCDLIDGE